MTIKQTGLFVPGFQSYNQNISFINGQLMTSEDVVVYITEIGSNQRKLQYCRQILTSNHSFMPQSIFRLKTTDSKNQMSRTQFNSLVLQFLPESSQEQWELIFRYFQIDGKKFITLDEFTNQITPKSDASLQKVLKWRDEQDFKLDYSLQYPLRKIFHQILENQIHLELSYKFQLQQQSIEHSRTKAGKFSHSELKQFLHFHGRYPFDSIIQLIKKQMLLNKGEDKRNKLIREYVIELNEYNKKHKGIPPKISAKLPAKIAFIKYEKQQRNKIKQEQYELFSKNDKGLTATPLKESNKSALIITPKNSLTELERKIKQIMSQVRIKSAQNESEDVQNSQYYKIKNIQKLLPPIENKNESPVKKWLDRSNRSVLKVIQQTKEQAKQQIIQKTPIIKMQYSPYSKIFTEEKEQQSQIKAMTARIRKRFNLDDDTENIGNLTQRTFTKSSSAYDTPILIKNKEPIEEQHKKGKNKLDQSIKDKTPVTKKIVNQSPINRTLQTKLTPKLSESQKNNQILRLSKQKREKLISSLNMTPKTASQKLTKSQYKRYTYLKEKR